jgi:hypothetical protein
MSVSGINVLRCGRDTGLGMMYRVSADWRAGYDPFDDDGWKTLPATLEGFSAHAYPITKVTPKGKWIDIYGGRKFILNDSRKRYACETLELAVKSFKARKHRQISILAAQLSRVENELSRIESPNIKVFDLSGLPGRSVQPAPEIQELVS